MNAIRNFVCLAAIACAGCAANRDSPDFERHRETRLTVPYERNDVVYYDAKFTPEFPDDNAAAEAKRMEWLEVWLDTKSMCADGYEIVERRAFRFEESNPGRYDVRYEIACYTPAPEAADPETAEAEG
jgi:hypothetical protein